MKWIFFVCLFALDLPAQRIGNCTTDAVSVVITWSPGGSSTVTGQSTLVIGPGQEINFGNWISSCGASNSLGTVSVAGTGSQDLLFCQDATTGALSVVTRSMTGDLWFFFAGFTLAVVLGLTGAMKRLLARCFDTSPEL